MQSPSREGGFCYIIQKLLFFPNKGERRNMERLLHYFTDGVKSCILGGKIGMEVETQFLNADEPDISPCFGPNRFKQGKPISVAKSQAILKTFASRHGEVTETKGNFIAEIRDHKGNRLLYELGRHNIELATVPLQRDDLIPKTREVLERLYRIGGEVGAYPYFQPILQTDEDLLVVPDERDAAWIRVDGREALKPLANISAVQFTIPVCLDEAIICLNRLREHLVSYFLPWYPQDHVWKRYIRESQAGYDPLRYGGHDYFIGLEDYCRKLSQHHFVDIEKNRLVPIDQISDLNIPLYLRSIWWYFRLKRYGDQLCIEVRPLGRYGDEKLEEQLDTILAIMLAGKRPLKMDLGGERRGALISRSPKYRARPDGPEYYDKGWV